MPYPRTHRERVDYEFLGDVNVLRALTQPVVLHVHSDFWCVQMTGPTGAFA